MNFFFIESNTKGIDHISWSELILNTFVSILKLLDHPDNVGVRKSKAFRPTYCDIYPFVVRLLVDLFAYIDPAAGRGVSHDGVFYVVHRSNLVQGSVSAVEDLTLVEASFSLVLNADVFPHALEADRENVVWSVIRGSLVVDSPQVLDH